MASRKGMTEGSAFIRFHTLPCNRLEHPCREMSATWSVTNVYFHISTCSQVHNQARRCDALQRHPAHCRQVDVAREAGQEAERFTELDDNANQTTPADTPNSNHEPRVRRTRAATP